MASTNPGLDIHNRSMRLVQQIISSPSYYKTQIQTVAKATVIDCGINVPGSQQAGILFSEIAMGGLADVRMGWQPLDQQLWPVVQVHTDHPAIACLACQHTLWFIQKGFFSATACGPALLLSQETDIYSEPADFAIVCVEGREMPTPEVVSWIARHCHISNENIFILIAPTASMVGSIQMASRSIETGIYKMNHLEYPVEKTVSAQGLCFLPPDSIDDRQALGRTNDAIIYGSVVRYTMADSKANLEALLPYIPSDSAADYGQLFGILFQRYGNFYNIDPNLFGPSRVYLTSGVSGDILQAGQLRTDLLKSSFGL